MHLQGLNGTKVLSQSSLIEQCMNLSVANPMERHGLLPPFGLGNQMMLVTLGLRYEPFAKRAYNISRRYREWN